jgi:RNA polymerase sigma factor (sigma-70 family)
MNILERYPNSESLSRGLADSEEQAFQYFSCTFGPRLRAYFIAKGLQGSDAEALAVSCVTDISLKASRYQSRPDGSFEAWVFTLARHALADLRRREVATVPLAAWIETADRPERLEDPSDSAVADAVWRGVRTLPPSDREIIVLRDLEGERSYSEIGERLAISEGAARARHLRATRKLKELLENDLVIQQLVSRGARRMEGVKDE